MRRPFGVAALDITAILKGQQEADEDKPSFVPYVPCGEHDFLDSLIKKVCTMKEVTQKEQKGTGILLTNEGTNSPQVLGFDVR